jgi:hypothetical protein
VSARPGGRRGPGAVDATLRRFRDLVRAAAPLNYSMRCRTVVDAVDAQHRRLADPTGPTGGQATSWGWLEGELAEAMTTPGTVAARLRDQPPGDDGAPGAPDALRSWVWRRLGSPGGAQWARGSESRSAWSLLMSPAPADDDELWWLASSNDLELAKLQVLIG